MNKMVHSLKSNGTGKTVIGDLQFQESNLFNNSNSNFIFNLTNTSGNAYLKFDNVNGMIPLGRYSNVLQVQKLVTPGIIHN